MSYRDFVAALFNSMRRSSAVARAESFVGTSESRLVARIAATGSGEVIGYITLSVYLVVDQEIGRCFDH